MAIQFTTYDDTSMQQGKFYLVEVNADQASNLRDIATITVPLANATQDISSLKADDELKTIQINNLLAGLEEMEQRLLDNQARVNNLEKTEVEKITEFIERFTITKPFINATHVEIEHSRRSVTNVLVVETISNTSTHKEYRCISTAWKAVEDQIDGVWVKKVIIESNVPITGYAILL